MENWRWQQLSPGLRGLQISTGQVGEKCGNLMECQGSLDCCRDKICRQTCIDDEVAVPGGGELCQDHFDCPGSSLCCPLLLQESSGQISNYAC